jgi:hypothetical protein
MTAAVKRKAFVAAGIARHAGHLDNFLFVPAHGAKEEEILLSDTDTCVELEALDPALRGPQLLRDMSNDTVRMISDLSQAAFTTDYLTGLLTGSCNPFAPFLRAYVGSDSPVEVRLAAQELCARYAQFLYDRSGRFSFLAGEHWKALTEGDGARIKQVIDNWTFDHVAFTPDCLVICYQLIAGSKALKGQGFTLPSLSREQLEHRFTFGVQQYMERVREEDRRVAQSLS